MKLPQGYEPHEIPEDYTGPLFIEGQMREVIRAERERCIDVCKQVLLEVGEVYLAEDCANAIRELKDEFLSEMLKKIAEERGVETGVE